MATEPTPDPTGQPAADSSKYTAEHIKVLEGVDAVRKRPAMFIGDTGTRGLHHLIYEVVDNSIDEAMAGFCQTISVKINMDGSVTISDDGRGIPVDEHPTEKKSALEVIMTKVHSGGKFDHQSYKVSGGLHGVGITCVNALSEWLEVEVRRDGHVYTQEYAQGVPTTPVTTVGKAPKSGTKITFRPDAQIFSDTKFRYETIESRLRELAFLNRGIRIKIGDERDRREVEFFFDGGLTEFVKYLNRTETVLHPEFCYVNKEQDRVQVEVALQYNEGFSECVFSYVNNINTIEGGTHLTGFRTALTRSINNYGKKSEMFKEVTPVGDDFREGLTAVISVRVPDPQFEGQTKTKLGNGEVEGIVTTVVNEALSNFLEENPPSAKKIAQKALLAAEARESARKARDLTRRKGAIGSGSLPGKLRDCRRHEVEGSELFLVEGDSAGGSADTGRDSEFQAILPLRGKILNVEKAQRLEKLLASEEIRNIFSAVGVLPGEEDISKRRYGRVVLMTDADVDGSHIRTLLLTFFYRQLPKLVAGGHVYVAQPPLYRVRQRKQSRYVQTDDQMRQELLTLGLEGAELRRADGMRFAADKLHQLAQALMRIEDSIVALERRGLSLRALIDRRQPDTGLLPVFHVICGNEQRWFAAKEQVDAFLQTMQAEEGEELELADDQAANGNGKPAKLMRVAELHEVRTLNKVLPELRGFGLDIDSLLAEPLTNGMERPPAFVLQRGDSEMPLEDLRGLLPAIRKLGERGLTITRFKGLGEMDAEELWETTMNPAQRTLLQVRMDDAQKAEEMFRILMGDQVEPRREFIETHALDVRNLDV
jgi:DNA gyrase subunit B